MEWGSEIILKLSGWMRPHLYKIAIAFIATLLAVYGGNINRLVKRLVRPYVWIIRLLAFVVLCSFVYGATVIWTAPLLAKFLSGLSSMYLSPVVTAAFLGIGVSAERKNRI